MTTALITHAASHAHLTPPGHPERPARIQALDDAFAKPEFGPVQRHDAPLADWSQILRCHPQSHIDTILSSAPKAGAAALDADTFLSPGSVEAARRGVGGNLMAVDLVLSGQAQNAFVACRPPGHHAETERAMGFCLFGNVAIAAKYALDHHGLTRVAVLDFDVHHGNGTQDLLWDEPCALFASTHQMPLYPGTGAPHERGAHDNIVNVPLQPGSGGAAMRLAFSQQILPRLKAFAPQLVLVSAGFDAHRDDPLAGLNWVADDFAWITRQTCAFARESCGGKVVSTLEGGYDLHALAESAAAHLRVLMEQ